MTIPFLALNYYDSIYFIIYTVITIALLIYKVENYILPLYALDTEVIIIILFFLTQYTRYKIGETAVIQKIPKKMVFYLVSSLLVILFYTFEIRFQTYVLLGDFILNWVGIGFIVFEIISSIWLLAVFQRKKNSP